MEQGELKNWQRAGIIAAQIVNYIKEIAKPGTSMLEIAKKVEEKITEAKAKPAFPINISCNEIAAHCSPEYNDETKINGLVKIDFGVSVDGYISDTAFSLDLSSGKKYAKLIQASNEALNKAIGIIKPGITLREIGKTIQETITSYGFSPIRNLSGHELKQYKLHSGLTIPNYDNGNETKLEEGQIIAIEPFATSGEGIVQDGKPSGIYNLIEHKPVRDSTARQILNFIEEEYKNLPFSSRWIINKFGTKALFALRILENAEAINQFAQLIEKSKQPISQAEHTIIVGKGILTRVEGVEG